jgi:hypothetical protein
MVAPDAMQLGPQHVGSAGVAARVGRRLICRADSSVRGEQQVVGALTDVAGHVERGGEVVN